jgi:peptidoglycan hydrolase CwlO-like protein
MVLAAWPQKRKLVRVGRRQRKSRCKRCRWTGQLVCSRPPALPPHLQMQRLITLRRGVLALAVLASFATMPAVAPAGRGDLGSRERALEQSVGQDTGQIGVYQGRLRDLRSRLNSIQSSLAIQRALLARSEAELAPARARLRSLRAELVRDRKMLAAELVAQYESPPPDLVDVVLESRGFSDLLERIDQMRRIARHNANVVKGVAATERQVHAETVRLTEAVVRRRRVTAAVAVEQDQVESLRLALLERERATARDRARKQAELEQVKHRLALLQARAAARQRASYAGGEVVGGPAPDNGQYGFFPAPGTNYSVGEEPEIAARLDRLGKALHLHLVGISGYRTPQHSVEVGGFADDPHTRGQASDTLGVEGVPEQILLRFGLTRPFPGPAEADHVQLS